MKQVPRHSLTAVISGVVAGVILLGVAASPGNPLLYAHAVCVKMNFVEQESLYTPLGLSNAPYDG